MDRTPFTRVGKQIMASGSHYADAADETAAQFTLDALNTKAFAITDDLLAAAKDIREDLLMRGEKDGSDVVVACGAGVWTRLNDAIAKATALPTPPETTA